MAEASDAPAAPEAAAAASGGPVKWYLCRMCRTELFAEGAIVAHPPMSAKQQSSGPKFRGKRPANEEPMPCSSFFVEAAEWMGKLDDVEGKLVCPKCSARVGTWKWDGLQCSCGLPPSSLECSEPLRKRRRTTTNPEVSAGNAEMAL
eukprot:m51a1_g6223 putative dual specificity protein phosphatase 12 (147) ;mRNA; f:226635-228472